MAVLQCLLVKLFHESYADSIRHRGTCSHFYKWLDTGSTESRRTKSKKATKLLTITKALTKTTNCTYKAKNVEGHDQKNFRRFAPERRTCAPIIRSGATSYGFYWLTVEQLWANTLRYHVGTIWQPSALDSRRFCSLSHILTFGSSDILSTHCL